MAGIISGLLVGAAASGSVSIVIQAIDKYSKEFKKVGKGVDNLGNKFSINKAVIVAAMTAAAVAVVAFAAKAVQAASQAESTAKRLGFVYGSVAKTVIAESRRMAKGTIFSNTQIQQSFLNTRLALEGLGIGFFQQQKLIETAMNLAAASGKPLEQVINDLRLAMMGMAKTARQYGIQVSETMSVQERYNAITGVGEKVSNAAKEATKTFAGQMQVLKNNFNDFLENAGKPMIGFLNTTIAAIGKVVKKLKEVREANILNIDAEIRAIEVSDKHSKRQVLYNKLTSAQINYYKERAELIRQNIIDTKAQEEHVKHLAEEEAKRNTAMQKHITQNIDVVATARKVIELENIQKEAIDQLIKGLISQEEADRIVQAAETQKNNILALGIPLLDLTIEKIKSLNEELQKNYEKSTRASEGFKRFISIMAQPTKLRKALKRKFEEQEERAIKRLEELKETPGEFGTPPVEKFYPKAQAGGVVLSPTLASLHPGETIVPFKARNMARNFTINIFANDAQDVAEKVGNILAREWFVRVPA